MPIYEYYCKSCSHEFETIQKITDEPITECENCGEPQAKRMISQSSFILKGSGWYVTDYSGKKSSENGHASANKPDSETSSTSDSSDSKPSKKPDPPKKAANA